MKDKVLMKINEKHIKNTNNDNQKICKNDFTQPDICF